MLNGLLVTCRGIDGSGENRQKRKGGWEDEETRRERMAGEADVFVAGCRGSALGAWCGGSRLWS